MFTLNSAVWASLGHRRLPFSPPVHAVILSRIGFSILTQLFVLVAYHPFFANSLSRAFRSSIVYAIKLISKPALLTSVSSSSVRKKFTLNGHLDKSWSQVSSLLSHGACRHFIAHRVQHSHSAVYSRRFSLFFCEVTILCIPLVNSSSKKTGIQTRIIGSSRDEIHLKR